MKKSSSVIDHIYSYSQLISSSGTLNINTSDHFPCYIIRKKPKLLHAVTTFTCHKLKHFQYAFFRNGLEDLDWRPFYESTDPNIALDLLYSMILKVIDDHYPEVTFRNVPVKATWLNADIFESMVKRDEAFETARSTNCPKDWVKAKRLRNKVVDLCTNAKNDHTRNNLRENRHNPKKFWSSLLKLWGTESGKGQNSTNLKNTNTGHETPLNETSNQFNDFFCNIASQIQCNIPQLLPDERKDLSEASNLNQNNTLPRQDIPEFNFRDVTNNVVKKLIKKIENHKSSGLQGIKSSLFKISAKILVPQFKFLFNLCLRTSIFPSSWKNTIVTPL